MVNFVDPFVIIAKVSNRMGAQAVSFLEAFITGEDKMLDLPTGRQLYISSTQAFCLLNETYNSFTVEVFTRVLGSTLE